MKKGLKVVATGLVGMVMAMTFGGCGLGDNFEGNWSNKDKAFPEIEKMTDLGRTPLYGELHVEKNGNGYVVNGAYYRYEVSTYKDYGDVKYPISKPLNPVTKIGGRMKVTKFWKDQAFVSGGNKNSLKPTVSAWNIESIDYIEKDDSLRVHTPHGGTLTMKRDKDKDTLSKYMEQVKAKVKELRDTKYKVDYPIVYNESELKY